MSVGCGVVGVVLWCGVLAPNFYAIFVSITASKCTTIRPQSRRDRATIAPRSGHDRCPGHASHALRSSGKNSTLKEQRSRLDRAAIAVRSRRDRGVLPQAFNVVRFNLQVNGRSRSLDRVNPDYESRSPSDVRRSRC